MTKRNGFTLIEIMVVIVILGVLAAVGVPKLFGMMAKAKAAEVPTAAGSYIHLQEVHLHNSHDIGTWRDIGYAAPGNGKTSNFVYNDCIQEKIPIQNNTESVTGWIASNTTNLNECTAQSAWAVVIDPKGENEVQYREIVSSENCASLTVNWAVENIDASACTAGAAQKTEPEPAEPTPTQEEPQQVVDNPPSEPEPEPETDSDDEQEADEPVDCDALRSQLPKGADNGKKNGWVVVAECDGLKVPKDLAPAGSTKEKKDKKNKN